MKKIVFIACSSKKRHDKTKAKDLYTSTLFKLNFSFAQALEPDKIFILSAKHGLVELDEELEPYEQTLNTMSADQIKKWAMHAKDQMKAKGVDFDNDKAVFLAGEKYRKYLLPHFQHSSVPLQGLSIGKQLQHLKNKTSHGK